MQFCSYRTEKILVLLSQCLCNILSMNRFLLFFHGIAGRCFCLLLFLAFPFWASGNESSPLKQELKVLVLIITSDHFPVYKEFQKIWKSYMHLDPAHFEVYFLRADPNMKELYRIDEDTIWSRTGEDWCPDPGILNKTIISLEAMQPRLDEFDYVLRTNLSALFVFPQLLNYLKTMPRQRCYTGSNTGENSIIGSGSGFIISSDVARMLISDRDLLIDHTEGTDDVTVGLCLKKRHGVHLIRKDRIDIWSLPQWQAMKDSLPSDVFHFRVKSPDEERVVTDTFIQSQLRDMFYPEAAAN